ncbi:KGG domain-containing protein [Nocardioides sp.]|uniref:KGG domain-containing protein n=1 Tax=Nocardioides sp. TaxID=35761 RepID=UPI0034DFB9A4
MRRNGGLKGGPARASSLSPERRKEIARMGGQASSLARRPLPKIDPGVLGKIKDV